MLRKEIMEFVNEIEECLPVDEWIIDGIHVWPLIRLTFALGNDESNRDATQNETYIKETINRINGMFSILKGISKYGYAYLRDNKKNSHRDRLANVVLLGTGASYDYYKDLWYERFCDPLVSFFNKNNYSTLIMNPLNSYRIPRYSSSMFIQPYLDYRRIRDLHFTKRSNFSEIKLSKYSEFLNILDSKSWVRVKPDIDSIKMRVAIIKSYAQFFESILHKVGSSLGMLVCYYCDLGMAFNLACRNLHIPSIDIQHGYQGEFHYAYGRWKKIPKKGYEVLPSFFWNWSDYEAETIRKWSLGVHKFHKPIVGEDLLLRFWQSEDIEIIKYYDRKINEIKQSDSRKVHVLFSAQKNIDQNALKPMLKIMKKTDGSHVWWIRLHPNHKYNKKRFLKIFKDKQISNFQLDAATNIPLHALLRNVDLHVTGCSSVVIEAKSFGVPSIVIEKSALLLGELKTLSSWIKPAFTLEEFERTIKEQLKTREALKNAQQFDEARKNNGKDFLLKLLQKSEMEKQQKV